MDLMKDRICVTAIDFGNACIFDDQRSSFKLKGGSTTYQPIEVILGNEWSNKRDVWGCGVVLFFLLGGTPFLEGDFDIVEHYLRKKGFSFGQKAFINGEITDFKEQVVSFLKLDKNTFLRKKVLNLLTNYIFVEKLRFDADHLIAALAEFQSSF